MHVEDKMSLEQFEQLKETFYRANYNGDNDGYLTKDQFKVAISGLLGIHDQDHMLSLLFVKVMSNISLPNIAVILVDIHLPRRPYCMLNLI